MTISLRDYLWINRKRFTNSEFARRLDVSPTYLSRVSSGAVMPSIKLAKRIEIESNGQVKWNELMEFCYSIAEASQG